MSFAQRLVEAQRKKNSLAVLGVDPQLGPAGVPAGFTLARFGCAIVEACAPAIVAIKPQLAFFEARGLDGMRALAEVIRFARSLGLLTIADAKRGDIGSTSTAYAEAFLGDGDFSCDAITVNPYLGTDAVAPFLERARNGRGVFVLVKTSNPSSGEFQDLAASESWAGSRSQSRSSLGRGVDGTTLWQAVAARVDDWGRDLTTTHDLSAIGAVVGATYPVHAERARALMPRAIFLVPGYGAQGAGAQAAVAAVRADGLGVIVNASRSLMYASAQRPGADPAAAAATAAEAMRVALNTAIQSRQAARRHSLTR